MTLPDFGFDLAGQRAPRLWHGMAFGVAAAALEALTYVILYNALSQALAGQGDTALALHTLLWLLLCSIALVAAKAAANQANYGGVYTLVAQARLRIADHLSRLPMGVFQTRRRGATAELLTGRFAHYQEIVARVWGQGVMNTVLPLLLALLLCLWQPVMGLTALILGPAAFVAIPWSHRLLSRADRHLAAWRERVVVAVLEQVEHQRELRQFDPARTRLQQARQSLAALEQEQLRAELAPAPALLLFGFLLQAAFAMVALLGATLGDHRAGMGAHYLVPLVIALRYFRALGDLGLNLAELRHAHDTLGQIRALMHAPALAEPDQARAPQHGDIVLQGLGFRYPGAETPALQHVHGHIRQGEFIALVGPSGSGKSTLAGLLSRMWDPTEGSISLGGVDLRALGSAELNRQIAVVQQEVVLIEGSIADNLRLGRPHADMHTLRHAAAAARADTFINRLPQGYDTPIDPQATGLSGGECQRLSIARALVKDAPILILDEALANVDVENACLIQQALSALSVGRTVIMIAHQLRTVVHADQIWVLQHGHLVQRGRHAELLARTGLYATLWHAQEAP